MRKDRIVNGNLKRLPEFARYDGNIHLKKAGVKIEYLEEQIEEIAHCAKDPIYFAETYCYIIDPNKGRCLIKLREYQKRYLLHLLINRHTILLSGRQGGKSITTAIFITWHSIFNAAKESAILANKEKIAKEIFNRVKIIMEGIPYWLQPGIEEWNATSISLGNLSKISCSATSSSAIRGLTISGCLLVDEFSFLPRNLADDFMASVFPTISASETAKVIIVSTPKGLNHFHSLWTRAIKGKNNFSPFEIKWNEVPGRDEVWLKRQVADLGELRVSQEYLAKFLGSSKTLIKPSVLELLEDDSPIKINDEYTQIYEDAQPGHTYCIGVDTAKGVGGNYSVCQVIDITDKEKFKQVAIYSNNLIGPDSFSKVCVNLAKLYNDAYLVIENNAEGYTVSSLVWNEEEYENVVDFNTNRHEIGIRATNKTKSRALDILKDFVENNKIKIVDRGTIYELSRFIEIRPGIYQAEEGETDDRVSALYWALYITTLESYYDAEAIKKNKEIVEQEIRMGKKIEDEDPLEIYLPGDEIGELDEFAQELIR